ncbi:MAG TPA: chromate transporter, partial [Burkholderiaceae bacterium]|nr:chromate transporter [Burkholderiaceae bacterium]
AAYLGAALAPVASDLHQAPLWQSALTALGWGLLALLAVFAPAWMPLAGALPFWEQWKQTEKALKAISGINAAVVGLLAAAWVNPVLSSALLSVGDAVLVAAGWGLLHRGRWPAWAVVGLACGVGAALGGLGSL